MCSREVIHVSRDKQLADAVGSPYSVDCRGYRPEIDGMRAIAVASVLLFHGNLGCPGGYVGVDVFFVISGFLITRILLNDLDDRRISLAHFWERRVRRILPILLVVIATTLVLGWFHFWPDDLASLSESALAMAVMCSNFHFWQETGYFDGPAESKPLLHTWSLAVEEQFYIIYPILLVWLAPRISKRQLGAWLWLIALGSFLLCAVVVYKSPAATFYLLPTRMWELLAGGLLAFHLKYNRFSHSRAVSEAVAWSGLVLIAIPIFAFDRETVFPGWTALLPVAGTASFIFGTSFGPTSAGWLLSWRALVGMGLISYSLYLWHWPIIVFARIRFTGVEYVEAWAIALSVVVSAVTYRYVESPFRRRWGSRKQVFSIAAIASLCWMLVCGWMISTGGASARDPVFSKLTRNATFEVSDRQLVEGRGISLDTGQVEDDQTRPDFVIVGDSHAATLLPMLAELSQTCQSKGVSLARAGRSPFGDLDRSRHIFDAIVKYIQDRRPRTVLLVARWSLLFANDSEQPSLDTDPDLIVIKRLIEKCLENGAAVKIMQQIPEMASPRDVVRFRQWQAINQQRAFIPNMSIDQVRSQNRERDRLLSGLERAGVQVLDPRPLFFDQNGWAIRSTSDSFLYWDDNHLTQSGAIRVLSDAYRGWMFD